MEFHDWLQARGIDPQDLSGPVKTHLQAQWRAEQERPAPPQHVLVDAAGNPVASAPRAAPQPAPQPEARPDSPFMGKIAAIEEESARRQYIEERTVQVCQENVGNPDRIKTIKEIGQAAIDDPTVSRKDFDLNLMRARFSGPLVVHGRSDRELTGQILEAAVCLNNRLPGVEQRFPDQVLQAAQTRFKRGLGLKELLAVAAERNSGYRGSTNDEVALCRAAFPRGDYGQMASAVSTIDVSDVLANVANKFLTAGFLYAEQSWRRIARITSANDFKARTTYRLTGNNKFVLLPPGGKIEHGSLETLPYTNQVQTYARMLGFDRRDIINDDLSALTGASSDLARGAGDSLNEIFWTEWLDDAAFFPTDKSLGNYDDGATDSVLSLAGLENADNIFAAQTKPDGTPLGATPRILLVPRGLRATAMTLMSATGLVGQGFNAVPSPNGNPWAGMFEVVSSTYLADTAIGGSATAWYLLADPMDLAAIEVAFLFGRETPTVETSEFDFNMLGMQMRAWMDFGISKQEYRAGVKLKGAA